MGLTHFLAEFSKYQIFLFFFCGQRKEKKFNDWLTDWKKEYLIDETKKEDNVNFVDYSRWGVLLFGLHMK